MRCDAFSRWLGRVSLIRCLAGWALALLPLLGGAVLPPSGKPIASLAYVDYADPTTRTVQRATSNGPVLSVGMSAAFSLADDATRTLPAGGSVLFGHTLTNTGNVSDRYDLGLMYAAGNGFDLSTAVLYLDADHDGRPDGSPLAAIGSASLPWSAGSFITTPVLAPGQSLNYIVAAMAPATAPVGASARVLLSARGSPLAATAGNYAPAAGASNTDTAVISNGARFSLVQSFSSAGGAAPASALGVTLNYVNNGSAASNVAIAEVIGADSNALPLASIFGPGAPAVAYNTAGLSYVPGSAVWSGRSGALSDAADGDEGGIQFAYDAASHLIRATVASVPAGASGTLSFRVDVNPGLPSGTAYTSARAGIAWGEGARALVDVSNPTSYSVESGSSAPNLTASLSGTSAMTAGGSGQIVASVGNAGSAASSGPIAAFVRLPFGVRFAGVDAQSASNWACSSDGRSDAGEQLNCVTRQVLPPQADDAAKRALVLLVRTDAAAFGAATQLSVSATVSGGGEPGALAGDNSAQFDFSVSPPGGVGGQLRLNGADKSGAGTGSALVGWRVSLCPYLPAEVHCSSSETDTSNPNAYALDTRGVRVSPAVTDAAGRFSFANLPPGRYKLSLRQPVGGSDVLFSTRAASGGSDPRQPVEVVVTSGVAPVPVDLPLDPSGVIYDSVTRKPVAGAVVRLLGPPGFDPDRHLFGGSANLVQTTSVTGSATDGMYQYLLTGAFPAGEYRIAFDAVPAGYANPAPSALFPPVSGALLPPNGCFMTNGNCSVDPAGSPVPPPAPSQPHYYTAMDLGGSAIGVINNHIPLDPAGASTAYGLLVAKTASRAQAEIGDFVEYTVRVQNASPAPMASAVLNDQLPFGFVYVPGSLRIGGVLVPDPARSPGRALSIALGSLGPGSTVTLIYRVKVGVGAARGDGTNSAQAAAGSAISNVARVKVKVVGGVLSDKAYLLGAVFADCNGNGLKDEDEPGVPGVRLFLEDGTWVVTDGAGRYSLYGLMPRTHIVKVDRITLPRGAKLVSLDNRNGGQSGTRFADIMKGEAHRADFAIACSPEVLAEIETIGEKLSRSAGALAETERLGRAPFSADTRAGTQGAGDTRSLPASGVIGQTGMGTPAPAPGAPGAPAGGMAGAMGGVPGSSAGVIPGGAVSPVAPAAPVFAPIGGSGQVGAGRNSANSNVPLPSDQIGPAQPAANPVTLEKLLPELKDNALEILDFKDGDRLPMAQMNVRIKGLLGTQFRLKVNDQEVTTDHVGKKSTLEDKAVQAWEYIGVNLKPGSNVLRAEQLDGFGNARSVAEVKVVAPAGLGRLHIDLPAERVADGRTPMKVVVRLTDADNVPVTSRTPVTLESKVGAWQAKDLNALEPGLQVIIEGGREEFLLLPPLAPADEELRVSTGTLRTQALFKYTPDLRPLIAAGVVEGAFNLRNIDVRRLVPVRDRDSFDREISRFTRESSDGTIYGGARAALYLKGKIAGDYLLTIAYDSDKDLSERVFRDIQPDQFYPVYGDSSVKGFDAQSTQRFYIRVDRGNSFVLYGDFPTSVNHPARMLSQYARSLTGAKGHFETSRVSSNAFASKDTLRQFVEELPANGTSGPYLLANKGFFINSEKISVLVRDRNAPAVVLKSTDVARFSDYEIEADTGRILFKQPVPSRDENLNPVSIRVAYEIDQGGVPFWVVGADAQVKVTESIEIGGNVAHDANPNAGYDLQGVNATVRLDPKTHVIVEGAQMNKGATTIDVTSPAAAESKGKASRVELVRREAGADMRAYAVRTDANFDNPASPFNKGRSEAGMKGTVGLDDKSRVSLEAIRSEDVSTGAHREGVVANAERTVLPGVKLELGVRHSRDVLANGQAANTAGASATPPPLDAQTTVTSARAKGTVQVPQVPEATAFGEYEQELGGSRRTAGVGGDYRFNQMGRVYFKHNFVNGISSPFALNATQRTNSTQLGVETRYMKTGTLFSEYRVRDAIDGQHAEAALGMRNQWEVFEGLRVSTSSERIKGLGGGTQNANANAYTGSAEYLLLKNAKLTGRLETRNGTAADSWLIGGGVAVKLAQDWTTLARATLDHQESHGTTPTTADRQRFQTGIAYRDTQTNRLSMLAKFEHTAENSTNADAPVRRSVDLVSTHANWHPRRELTFTGRFAGKWVNEDTSDIASVSSALLMSGRVLVDLNSEWDMGVQTSVMSGDGILQYGLGSELGYRLSDDLWFSVGYNFFGFKDRDFASLDSYERGIYARLRWKFDEDLFGADSRRAEAPLALSSSHEAGKTAVAKDADQALTVSSLIPEKLKAALAKARPEAPPSAVENMPMPPQEEALPASAAEAAKAVKPVVPVMPDRLDSAATRFDSSAEARRDAVTEKPKPPEALPPGSPETGLESEPEWLTLRADCFVEGAAALSSDGEAKLLRIARWVQRTHQTVALSLRDGGEASIALRDARLEASTEALVAAGIPRARIKAHIEHIEYIEHIEHGERGGPSESGRRPATLELSG